MTYTPTTVQEFLAELPTFGQLPSAVLNRLSERFQLLRYRMGQAILVREKMPTQVSILYQGQARLLGYDPRLQAPSTLKLLGPGEVLGWVGLVRGVPCETAIASTETVCLTLPAADFLALLSEEPLLAKAFCEHCGLVEVFDLLGAELQRRADGTADLKALTLRIFPEALTLNLTAEQGSLRQLDPDRLWLVSSSNLTQYPVGSRVAPDAFQSLRDHTSGPVRLIGFQEPNQFLNPSPPSNSQGYSSSGNGLVLDADTDIPFAPDRPPEPEIEASGKPAKYPYIHGRGPLDATLACFQMLCLHLGLPFRRDMIRKVVVNQMERSGSVSLQLCGGVAELIGLNAQLANVPASAISRLQTPALVRWQDSFAILYEVSEKEVVLASPETGLRRPKTAEFLRNWGEEGEVLLLKVTESTPKKRFSLSWFLPSLYRYRRVLSEVLLASFFVQLFGLANPLMTQIIIDKVLVQNSVGTLNVLGVILVLMAVFEAVLTALRTYLFVDTTNRIDLALGSEIIDHLLRLPLRYFERRPVGELGTRINELENIRQFLTGTALTVVLDAIFSVIYIVVMVIYSWLLTIVALATVPLFALLTAVVAPIVRQQLRSKAERNAETQSYLVEVLSGIQTVKAQNIELRSRWQWQERYARYVSAGFQTVLTSTTASSISGFLNKLSGLLLLWVGAYLVLDGKLTLGQLIAFRIIAGYTTSPLLRLVQLWQNFQETALSLERLSDIIDTPQEADELDRRNIPMPSIQGAVKYEDVSFRFNNTGAPQLININVEFPAGVFVGIVGQSGSGKSTLMKLLQRLYEPNSGRILIDGYDISKVELYSLRRQVGMVLQDTLLFDGTIQDNIALTNPDATSEEIIEAARIAFAHDFIMSLPNGYNTRVGERGSALSGGQRQRIAIARTVLQNPRLLVLDEATSALDYHAERQVCLNLAEASRDRTVFFITHRLTTIKNADVILMMDQGAVVEQGSHEELMALRGRYYCLYQQQEAQL
ncbi:peptidase domain-containing ABC transporter [Leptolyngbya sp. FACHB-261]|uniref:peptidase domain-containing ABC transporter n=1 Tax=Leptolyngbya sp. FACHB-261 TaxID=2692806 RepID=UPI001682762D|nr:peptidase domain-containing ABC transporter [Leptolyngbya sp. FACHB-261]MBD2105126.1 peptidase domain-containing ABC transporter [Leptolyngbya sp. FACHB-261]